MTSEKKTPRPAALDTAGTLASVAARTTDDVAYAGDSPPLELTRLERERQAFHIITEAAVSHAELPEICQTILWVPM